MNKSSHLNPTSFSRGKAVAGCKASTRIYIAGDPNLRGEVEPNPASTPPLSSLRSNLIPPKTAPHSYRNPNPTPTPYRSPVVLVSTMRKQSKAQAALML